MGSISFDAFKAMYRCGLFRETGPMPMAENDMEVIMSLGEAYRPKVVMEVGPEGCVSPVLLRCFSWITSCSRTDSLSKGSGLDVDMVILGPDDEYERAKANTDNAVGAVERKGGVVVWMGCSSAGVRRRLEERNKFDSRVCFVTGTNMAFQIVRSQPEYFLNVDSRFCIVSAHTEVSDTTVPGWEGWGRLGRATMENKLRYCQKRGYGMMGFTGGFDMNIAPSWSKLLFMRKALERYEWALWMDTDAGITNPEIGLDVFVDEKCQAVFEREAQFTGDINGGVFMLRRGDFSRWLIEELLKRAGERDPWKHPWEQEAINELFREGLLKDRAKVLEDMAIGKHPSLWSRGDFGVHVFLAHGERMTAVQRLHRFENIMRRAGRH